MSLEPHARERLDSKGRVHFVEAQLTPDHSGQIHVELHGNHADAHLGFLQKNRKYGLLVTIPKYLGDKLAITDVNPHVHLTGSKTDATKSKHMLNLELVAHKDGLQNEELKLKSADNEHLTVTLSARVLGLGKGTPMLKSGIHLLGVELADDESLTSDGDHH